MIAAKSTDRSERVASVLARATALSEELRYTIRELEHILKQGEENQGRGR